MSHSAGPDVAKVGGWWQVAEHQSRQQRAARGRQADRGCRRCHVVSAPRSPPITMPAERPEVGGSTGRLVAEQPTARSHVPRAAGDGQDVAAQDLGLGQDRI